ncbi:aluminum-activated malate transporter 2-like [Senna tora]|uniref:Aluminum-activated malate transporter 2-like n=1 Tax=Senna tora TaxID=362788 RepID=A0A834SLY8_9FABA|nr:aluminum-activated malate transporter 2-like [Senna tora]
MTMIMSSPTPENVGNHRVSCGMRWVRELGSHSWAKLRSLGKKLGEDDPIRRITHSLKVGLALTLVSLLFYLQPFYHSFGADAMWAIISVVVVMEFSVGATIGKGLNRMLATLVGGCLGVGVVQLASVVLGKREQPILIAIFLYIIGTIMTFVRFVGEVKARYDYGMLIFILTYSLVSISGYRDDENDILELACKRVLTIIIGSFIAIIISIFIFPVWNGNHLHNLVANNLDNLANYFLQGFGDDLQPKTKKSFAEEYESLLSSKTREETMIPSSMAQVLAPWKLNTTMCLQNGSPRFSSQTRNEVGMKIKDSCECAGKVMKILSSSIKSMTCLSTRILKAHIGEAKGSIESLQSLLGSKAYWEEVGVMEIASAAAITSLLTHILICTQTIMESVDELSSLAHFKPIPITTTHQPLPLCREGPILDSNKLDFSTITIDE